MKPEDFDLLATLTKRRAGLILARDKGYLLELRLMPVMRKFNLKSLEDLAQAVRSRRDEDLLDGIAGAMAANESSFFRGRRPFDRFRQMLLPQLLKNRTAKKRIRIWSAACSSGQEAYSLAMICAEEQALAGWQVDIVGTDLSAEMVARARSGIYTQFEVQRGLPVTMLVKYFRQLGGKWQIAESLRRMVQFRAGNLLQGCGAPGVFDVVFCRNVLSYFDQPARVRVLDAIAGSMPPDGFLFLGSAETVSGLTEKFEPAGGQSGIYALAGASSAGQVG